MIETPLRGWSAAAQSVDEFPSVVRDRLSIPAFLRLYGEVGLGALPERTGRVPDKGGPSG
ncbi:hypothetical protein [Streptomyces mirabilis]|uniref:hypothetical protein n=1 Tax=Streptomyces mirabilis TaxID=68239 RepID=UPI002E321182|nr:hypothetical protein [Streptomyces mirabilis]